MASESYPRRNPVLTGLFALPGLLVLGGSAYFATDRGRNLTPTLEKPTLTISDISREKLREQMVVHIRNNATTGLKIDSLRYEMLVDGKRLA